MRPPPEHTVGPSPRCDRQYFNVGLARSISLGGTHCQFMSFPVSWRIDHRADLMRGAGKILKSTRLEVGGHEPFDIVPYRRLLDFTRDSCAGRRRPDPSDSSIDNYPI